MGIYEHEDDDSSFENIIILHVDDVDYNRDVVAIFLENDNIEVIEAETGKEALAILETNTPDIILMDIQMPELNGYETTKMIRENKKFNSIPIFALTASGQKEEIKEYSHIFDEYLIKPIIKKSLIETISKYLTLKKNNEFSTNVYELNQYKKRVDSFSDELRKIFADEFKILYKLASQNVSVDNLMLFSKRIKEIAVKYNINELLEYSNTLNKAINNFNKDKINILLNFFPKFIETTSN